MRVYCKKEGKKFGKLENNRYLCTTLTNRRAKKWRFHLAVRIPASHAGYTSSSLVGATKRGVSTNIDAPPLFISKGVKFEANRLFEPLKVLRTLMAFGANREQGYSTFNLHSSVNSLSETLTPSNISTHDSDPDRENHRAGAD